MHTYVLLHVKTKVEMCNVQCCRTVLVLNDMLFRLLLCKWAIKDNLKLLVKGCTVLSGYFNHVALICWSAHKNMDWYVVVNNTFILVNISYSN